MRRLQRGLINATPRPPANLILVMLDAKETPERFPQGFRVHLPGLNEWVQKRMGSTLKLLFGGVALMLLIGCANVSILLLARGTRRRQELAVRASVRATELPCHIERQLEREREPGPAVDTHIQILDEAGFLPTGGFGMVELNQFPRG
jgi:hypothetical protein